MTDLWQVNRTFFQADFVKGGGYLDEAGKIVNELAADYYEMSVAPGGLRLTLPKSEDLPDEISVNVDRAWIQCLGADGIERMTVTATRITQRISGLIGVDSYRRLGLRVFYFQPEAELESYAKKLHSAVTAPAFQASLGSSGDVTETQFLVKTLQSPFLVSVALRPLVIGRPPRTKADYPTNGMILDIDVGENANSSSRELSPRRVHAFLDESSGLAREKAEKAILFLRSLG